MHRSLPLWIVLVVAAPAISAEPVAVNTSPAPVAIERAFPKLRFQRPILLAAPPGDAGDRLRWRLLENVPGEFPYTSGTFPFKREAEDPTRMFAGEGPAARTNARFHLLAGGQPAKRLSTAFDSITLYGEDPARRPDIYGKIGESGVSIFTVDEAE